MSGPGLTSRPPSLARLLAALVLFGLAFGVVEGAVVVNLRGLHDPLYRKLRPGSLPGDLFPILSIAEIRQAGPEYSLRLRVELAREAATIVMLAAVPWVFSRNFREWIAGFMIGFGVWDLAYYATLKLALGWPESLWTWDLLFLLPVPWSGPVLAPCLVSLSIVGAGVMLLHREATGRAIRLGVGTWVSILTGGLIVILSFCWKARTVGEGGLPGPFPWWVFGAGEILGLIGFIRACRLHDKK